MRAAAGQPTSRHRGLSLIDATFAVVIVSLMLVAAVQTFGSAARTRLARSGEARARGVALELITEVLQAQYVDPDDPGAAIFGVEAGESAATRADFDDVDDYRNWSASPPQSRDGTSMTHLSGWTRACAVQKVDALDLAAQGDLAADTGTRQVTVTVTRPDGRTTTLTALRVNTSALEQAPALDTSYTQWIGVELQVGPELRSRVQSGAAVLNHRPPLLGGDGGTAP